MQKLGNAYPGALASCPTRPPLKGYRLAPVAAATVVEAEFAATLG
ncbi:MAG: hypothetical protein ACFCVD_16320 [Nodosilinea sp.]